MAVVSQLCAHADSLIYNDINDPKRVVKYGTARKFCEHISTRMPAHLLHDFNIACSSGGILMSAPLRQGLLPSSTAPL